MANRFLSNISINDAYTFPATDGTTGQVITTDGSGNLSFSDVPVLDGARSNFVYYDVKNSSGSTINKGTAVMAVGTDGNSGHVLIAPMVADGSIEPRYFMGVLETTLSNGQSGKVVHFGQISQLNTTAFDDGDVLWCDPANAGGFTITEPLGPNLKIAAAIVINSAVNGKIKVRVQGNAGLHELHDVKLVSEVNGDLLQWNGTTSVWENKSLATIADGRYVNTVGDDSMNGILTARAFRTLESSTTYSLITRNSAPTNPPLYVNNGQTDSTSRIARFAYADTAANSGTEVLSVGGDKSWFVNTNLGVGTSDPSANLDVVGNAKISGNLTVDTNTLFVDSVNNRVGIGTDSPSKNLHVAGDSYFNGKVGIGITPTTTWDLRIKGEYPLQLASSTSVAKFEFYADLNENRYLNGAKIVGFNQDLSIDTSSSSYDILLANAGGNVGIGTTSPGTKLEVSGSIYTSADSTAHQIRAYHTDNAYTQITGYGIEFARQANYLRPLLSTYDLYVGDSSYNWNSITQYASKHSFQVGNVGIGTASPVEKLDVAGTARMDVGVTETIHYAGTGFQHWGDGGTGVDFPANDTIDLLTSSSSRVRVDSIGNVGIGTTTPSEKLEVAGNAKVTGSLSVQNIQYASGDILTVSESGTITKINRDNAAELLGVNSKTLMQDLSFGESYINNYRSRVLDNTGTYFPTPAGYNFGVLKNKGYLEKAGVVLLPSGVKTSGLFSVKPKNGNGDFDFTRNSIATYVDEDGLIQVAEANVPRLDYPILNGVVQSCPALLLEPSRTNVLLRSEEFDIAAWQRAGCAATANQTTSPSGDLSADLIQENTSTGSHDIRQGATVVSGTIYTYSLFVKRYEGGAARNITFFIGGPNGAGTFNFDTESWESISGLDSFGFDKLNGGWYRLYFTDTAVSTSFNTIIILNNGTTTSYTGDNVSGLYLWGAQLELGSYATSYIPTSGSTVTRAVDSAYKTGISSLIGQTEGALFVECSALANDATNRRITISDGTSSNRIYLSYKNFSNQLRVEVISAGSSVFDFTYTIADITQTIKMAMTYKLNDFAFYVNGVQVAVDTSGAVPTSMSVFKFEDGAGGNVFFGKTKQLIAFNAALTDEQLEDLTSWDSFEELAASQFYTLY